jgi:hypothetical protein
MGRVMLFILFVMYQGVAMGGNDEFVSAYSNYLFEEIIVDSFSSEDVRENNSAYKQAAHNAALCHDQKVSRLSQQTQDLWRRSFVQKRTLDGAADAYIEEVKGVNDQLTMVEMIMDFKKLMKTGLCNDEMQEELNKVILMSVINKSSKNKNDNK